MSRPGRGHEWRFVAAGAMLLAVAMGVGRFAYTPILPLMERDAGLGVSLAGGLASSNLLGYLIGALLAMTPALRARRLAVVRWAIAGVVVTTALMALPAAPVWLVARFATGVASGFVLIFASSIVIDRAARQRKPAWPGLFFGGVGLGVAFTGATAAPLALLGGSRWSWLGLAVISGAIALIATPWFTDDAGAGAPAAPRRDGAGRRPKAFGWVLLVYGIQGFSYIIPATFVVAMVSATPAIARFAASSWIIVGLVAAVSTTLWTIVAARLGKSISLVLALLLQAAGIAAGVLLPNAFGVAFAAFALGGTFMGMTWLATGLAKEMLGEGTSTAIGQMTALYSVGQIIGPLAATAIVLRTGSYGAALLCASFTATLSAAIAFGGLCLRKQDKNLTS